MRIRSIIQFIGIFLTIISFNDTYNESFNAICWFVTGYSIIILVMYYIIKSIYDVACDKVLFFNVKHSAGFAKNIKLISNIYQLSIVILQIVSSQFAVTGLIELFKCTSCCNTMLTFGSYFMTIVGIDHIITHFRYMFGSFMEIHLNFYLLTPARFVVSFNSVDSQNDFYDTEFNKLYTVNFLKKHCANENSIDLIDFSRYIEFGNVPIAIYDSYEPHKKYNQMKWSKIQLDVVTLCDISQLVNGSCWIVISSAIRNAIANCQMNYQLDDNVHSNLTNTITICCYVSIISIYLSIITDIIVPRMIYSNKCMNTL